MAIWQLTDSANLTDGKHIDMCSYFFVFIYIGRFRFGNKFLHIIENQISIMAIFISVMVKEFGMNLKVQDSSPALVEIFSVAKTSHFHRKIRLCVKINAIRCFIAAHCAHNTAHTSLYNYTCANVQLFRINVNKYFVDCRARHVWGQRLNWLGLFFSKSVCVYKITLLAIFKTSDINSKIAKAMTKKTKQYNHIGSGTEVLCYVVVYKSVLSAHICPSLKHCLIFSWPRMLTGCHWRNCNNY